MFKVEDRRSPFGVSVSNNNCKCFSSKSFKGLIYEPTLNLFWSSVSQSSGETLNYDVYIDDYCTDNLKGRPHFLSYLTHYSAKLFSRVGSATSLKALISQNG
jgi:hypothetical protein